MGARRGIPCGLLEMFSGGRRVWGWGRMGLVGMVWHGMVACAISVKSEAT